MEAITPAPALIAYAIAHEVRNLLTPASAHLELAKSDSEHAAVAIERTQAALERVLAFADAVLSAGHADRCDVRTAVMRALEGIPAARTNLRLEIPSQASVLMALPILERVVANLVSNAVEAAGSGGIRISCSPGNSGWRLEVSDSGPGIRPGTKRPARGRGLQICAFLVEQCGGSMTICSRLGQGCCITLDLPAAADSLQRKAA